MIGQASCGCFGQFQLNPWIAFAGDLTILALLYRYRPDRAAIVESLRPLRTHLWDAVTIAGGVAVIAIFLCSVAVWGFGSVDAAMAYLRGDLISVDPGIVELGEGSAGAIRKAEVCLTNRMDRPVTLIGGTSDCSCIVINNLPATLQPGESVNMEIVMLYPTSSGRFMRSAEFYAEADRWIRIPIAITGVCHGKENARQSDH